MIVTFFDTALILLLASIITSSLFQRFNIPVIVGYIAVGVALGPYALGILDESKNVQDLAEFGLVFLMFNIGLEFSFSKIIKMKKAVFVFGSMEVILAIAITTCIGTALTMSAQEALIIGCIVAMSSTAIVVKQLSIGRQLMTTHGENAVGILLFQDLAVIPMLILVPSLAAANTSLSFELIEALLKALAAILVIYVMGRLVLRPLFFSIAKMKNLEVFTLTALFVTLGSAWLTHEIGLSMTLGAFVAGMMLGETEYRHQIENDIRPFRDVLVGFFFITIGIKFNIQATVMFWPWVLILLFALVLFKTALVFSIAKVIKIETKSALKTSLILAHGGEFGFAILALALSYQLLPTDYGQVTLAALMLSMIVAPIMTRYSNEIASMIIPKKADDLKFDNPPPELMGHIVIGGYGRVGQTISEILETAEIPMMSFDLDPAQVRQAQVTNHSVFYADLTHHNVFEKAHLDKASALILSFNNTSANLKIIEQIRTQYPELTIIARAHDTHESDKLIEHGASFVVPEVLEASLAIAALVLSRVGVEPAKVELLLNQHRKAKESNHNG